MLNKIRYLLYKYNIIKPKTFIEKVNYILYMNIDIYSKLSYNKRRFINKDIIKSMQFMEFVLQSDFKETYIDELLKYEYYYVTLTEWFTENDRMIINPYDTLYKWLCLAVELKEKYEYGIKDKNTGKLYANSNKLKPYIINIEEIVEDVLKN